jgi:inhibitor of cysteine peptidase
MKHEDLVKKLENLKTPDIELPGHRQALRMALLNSGRFRRRTAMNWARVVAPITAAVLLVVVIGILAVDRPGPLYLAGGQITKFDSYDELQEFVNTNVGDKQPSWRSSGGNAILAPGGEESFAPSPPMAADSATGYSGMDYSATNIQVAAVDEADVVKTDGEYVYLVSGNKTIIVQAYPAEEAQIVSEIELHGTIIGIFINGDRLVLFEQETPYYLYYDYYDEVPAVKESYAPYVSPSISVGVYDVSDRANPQLAREVSSDGQYVSSRMIGDYAYVVLNEPVYEENDEVKLPRVSSAGNETEIPATDIYYSDVSDSYYMYTTIIAVNTQNDAQEPAYETILLGASSTLYVSPNNIYLTFPVWGSDVLGREVWDSPRTSIHRIHIEGDAIEYVASGEVPGMVLDQFSMDEYDGHFRVATTTWGETTANHVYILDMDLNIVGSVEDLAPGETIYSARFMGERGYLVTFKQVDPLFVIDLSDPSNPRELGYLKVTGYSDYLHPYDETHIIGIGKETTDAGEFAWYQGVKISLFDVSDVSNPQEIDKLEIGDRGSDSPVLWDHKAFLFDRARNLLVMPILVAEVDQSEYPEGVPSWAYGEPVWQGAYVFDISIDEGLQIRGRITHIDDLSQIEEGYYYYYSPFAVERSLYIGDVLYTISQAKIKMNSLETLDPINEVELPYTDWTPYDYPEETRVEEPAPPPDTGSGDEELLGS